MIAIRTYSLRNINRLSVKYKKLLLFLFVAVLLIMERTRHNVSRLLSAAS